MDDLERAVHEQFSRDALAVYGDALVERGDPRGELIALELAPQATPAWHERRRAVMAGWVGKRLVGPALQRTRFGFLGANEDEDGLALLASPAGAHVRWFAARGERRVVNHALRKLIGELRPWLVELTIAVPGERDAIDPSLAAALVYRTPELREVHLDGRALLELPHPRIRRAVISGFDALRGGLPDATHLDLSLHATTADPVWQPTRVAAIVDFPRLRVLDLSRNERGRLGGDSNIIETLEASRLAGLDELILPSLTVGQAQRLEHLELPPRTRLARSYHELPAIAGVDIPARFPWPSPAELMPRDALAFETIERVDHHSGPLAPLIEALERAWATLPRDVVKIWTDLFDLVDNLGGGEADYPKASLARAIEALALEQTDWVDLAVACRMVRPGMQDFATVRRQQI